MSDSPDSPTRRRRWPWVLGGLFVLLLLLVFAFFKDDTLEDFSDLAPVHPPPAPDGTPALRFWSDVATSIDATPINSAYTDDPDFSDRLRGFKPWQPGPVELILDANRSPLADMLAAASDKPFALPRARSIEEAANTLPPFYETARLLQIAAAERSVAGDFPGATDYALVCLKLGQNVLGQSPSFIALMTGITLHTFALSSINALASRPDVPAAELDRIAKALAIEFNLTAAYRRALRFEFALLGDTLDQLEKGNDQNWSARDTPSRLLFKRNRTHNKAATLYRAELVRLAAPPASHLPATPPAPPAGLAKFSSNAYGDWFNSTMIFTGRLTNVIYSQLTMRRLLTTKIALLRHRADTGSLPPTLSDLVPNQLDSVPLDRFDGAPLRYDAARGAIWSIGENLIDEGGATAPSPGALKIGSPDPTMFAQP